MSPAARASRWADQDSQQSYDQVPPRAWPSPDPIQQLKELGELRDKGVLTEEEFAAQKAKLLGS